MEPARDITNDNIPYPKIISPPGIEIIDQVEYLDRVWEQIVDLVGEADVEVQRFRYLKSRIDRAYEAAMDQRAALQRVRDEMIATDSRIPARIGRVAGVGRSRCSQVREKTRRAMGLPPLADRLAAPTAATEAGA